MHFVLLASVLMFIFVSTDCIYVSVLQSPLGSCSQKDYENVQTRMKACMHQPYEVFSRNVQDYCIPVKEKYSGCVEEYANSNCWLNSQKAEIHRASVVFGKLWQLFCNIKNVSSNDINNCLYQLGYDIKDSCPQWSIDSVDQELRLTALPEEICSLKDCVKLNTIYCNPQLRETINEGVETIFEGLECDKRPKAPKVPFWEFEKYFTSFENNGTTPDSNNTTWSNESNSSLYGGGNGTALSNEGNSTS